MKIWKIYAQCCRSTHPYKEVYDEKEMIGDAYSQNEEVFWNNISADTRDKIDEMEEKDIQIEGSSVTDYIINEIYSVLENIWKKDKWLDCGDYIYTEAEDMADLSRPSKGADIDFSHFKHIEKKILEF